MGEPRTPVGRSDFKSDERRQTSLVGSTPTLFRPTSLPLNSNHEPAGHCIKRQR